MVNSRAPIRGRVAKILNKRELVINRGSNDGVVLGMKFAVLDAKGENITDPETGDVLGSVDRPKVEVEVVRVQERLSLARTFKGRRVNIGGTGFGPAVSDVFSPPRYVTQYETLRTNESTLEDLDDSQSIIKTGDPLEQILDSPAEEYIQIGASGEPGKPEQTAEIALAPGDGAVSVS